MATIDHVVRGVVVLITDRECRNRSSAATGIRTRRGGDVTATQIETYLRARTVRQCYCRVHVILERVAVNYDLHVLLAVSRPKPGNTNPEA